MRRGVEESLMRMQSDYARLFNENIELKEKIKEWAQFLENAGRMPNIYNCNELAEKMMEAINGTTAINIGNTNNGGDR